jgi:hypothetical protein
MIAVTTTGPYEHRGAYQESELFDTSGVPEGFCSDCEHAPCVAGYVSYCAHRPRFISTTAVAKDIEDLANAARKSKDVSALWVALRLAIGNVEGTAWSGGFDGDMALNSLATIRRNLTDRVAAPKDKP